MNKTNLILLVACLFFVVLFASEVRAQQYTIHHIDPWTNDNVDSKPNSGVKVVNEDRSPTLQDIIDGMRKKRKVTAVLAPDGNSTHSWAVRVVGMNLTSYLTTNGSRNWTNNFIVLYDPVSHAYVNTTVATMGNNVNNTAYIYVAGEWRGVIALTMIYKSLIKTGGPVYARPIYFEFISLFGYGRTRLFLFN